jgi:serine protease Do
MKSRFPCAALAALVVAATGWSVQVSGAGTTEEKTQPQPQYLRKTPIVEAVQKTKNSVVVINAVKRRDGSSKDIVGTGVIVDERGYVVTNRHVIAGSERLSVTLADGTDVSCTLVAHDKTYDLAILKLSGNRKYQELRFATGSDLMVGETVIAIGNPFGYTNSVSTGIISYVGREVEMDETTLKNVIQHTAAINPGNSGGPLLNINGELIGITVALRQGAQGIAFALNADTVQSVLAHHLSASRIGKVEHGLTVKEVVKGEGFDRQKVMVEKVAPNSLAASAGIKSGDILVKVAGRPVSNRFDVERALWESKAGDKVAATVLREGKPTQVALALERGEPSKVAAEPVGSKSGSSEVQTVGR